MIGELLLEPVSDALGVSYSSVPPQLPSATKFAPTALQPRVQQAGCAHALAAAGDAALPAALDRLAGEG